MDKPLSALPVAGEVRTLVKKYGKWVIEQDFLLPDGTTVEYVLFLNPGKGRPNAVLPITDDGQVIVIEQFRYGINRVILEIPGGSASEESPKDAMIRELREETGYEAQIIIELGSMVIDPSFVRGDLDLFLALGCKKVSELKLDNTEFITVRTFPASKWVEMCMDGTITDTRSATATLRALPHLLRAGMELNY